MDVTTVLFPLLETLHNISMRLRALLLSRPDVGSYVCVCVCARVCVIKHVINLVDMNKTKSKTNGILVQFITIATNVHPTEAVMDQ